MAAMVVLLSKTFIQATHRLHALHQQHAQKGAALLADRSQSPPFARAVFARNQPEIAGHLLAAGEARDIAHRDHNASDVIGPTPG